MWDDLTGTLRVLDAVGVAYVTVLFFKENTHGARTPADFLKLLRANHPELLDPHWQAERLAEVQSVFGSDRVRVGKEGFASLAKPHHVVAAIQTKP